MSKETDSTHNYQCRCNVTLRTEHLNRLKDFAQAINENLQLVSMPLDADHVLQLLLNQHLEKIGTELVEFSKVKAHQSGRQLDPAHIRFSVYTDRKKSH